MTNTKIQRPNIVGKLTPKKINDLRLFLTSDDIIQKLDNKDVRDAYRATVGDLINKLMTDIEDTL